MHHNELRRVGIAVVIARGHCLIGPRNLPSRPDPIFEFPGGKCEYGETHKQAALRECLEETGLDVEPVTLMIAKQHRYNVRTLDIEFWECRLSPEPYDDQPLPQPTAPFFWTPLSQLGDYPVFPANEEIVQGLTNRHDRHVSGNA